MSETKDVQGVDQNTRLEEANTPAEEKALKTTTKKTNMDKIVEAIAYAVASTSRNERDERQVRELMTGVLNTLMSINALDEYAIGLKVDGTLYRFNEYEVTEGLSRLVNGAKIVLRDVPSARDFADRSAYIVSGGILTPSEVKSNLVKLGRILRVNLSFVAVSRQFVELLTEAVQYACVGGTVAELRQPKIVFLSQKFDSEQDVKVTEWARMFGSNLFV